MTKQDYQNELEEIEKAFEDMPEFSGSNSVFSLEIEWERIKTILRTWKD